MKNHLSLEKLVVWAGFVTLFLIAGALTQASSSGNYSLEIIVDGVPLSEMHARGNTYIEAIEGREYSIRLSNHSSGRIAIALSVDGLNSIDAKTTSAGEATKWILNPYQTITIDGWQTNSSTGSRYRYSTHSCLDVVRRYHRSARRGKPPTPSTEYRFFPHETRHGLQLTTD